VFPLPNVVLFPGMFLPLHIFEPRYRQMTRAALEGERLIAMALLRPGGEKDGPGAPSYREVLGLGRIVEDARLEDGRFNLVLQGQVRVRATQETQREPYRIAQVEVLDELPAAGAGYDRKRRLLLAFYSQVMKEITQGSASAPPSDVPLGMVCDLLASLIAFEASVKQELLEELRVAARCDRLLRLLEQLKAPGFGNAREAPKRPWPPDPSFN